MAKFLEWKDEYSVGIQMIDGQHKVMFSMINELVEMINSQPDEKKISQVIDELLNYKKIHFGTEEKFFKEFNYEGATDHIKAHKRFGESIDRICAENKGDILGLTFALVDFLEDWLVNHLLDMDHKYVNCFRDHGLK